MAKFIKLIKIFFNIKLVFLKPPKKKILIFDSDLSDILSNYFNKNEIHILDVRYKYKKNQKLNLYVLFKMLLKFKFSTEEYFFLNNVFFKN